MGGLSGKEQEESRPDTVLSFDCIRTHNVWGLGGLGPPKFVWEIAPALRAYECSSKRCSGRLRG